MLTHPLRRFRRRSFRSLLRRAFPAADQCQSILGIEWELPDRRLTSRAQRNIHAAIACKNNRSQISKSPLTLFRAQLRIVLDGILHLVFAQNVQSTKGFGLDVSFGNALFD